MGQELSWYLGIPSLSEIILYKSYKGIEGNIGHTKSALPLLCNHGRRFIAGASYGGLEIKKALMNFGVFVLQKARIYITLYMNKAYPFAPIPTPKGQ